MSQRSRQRHKETATVIGTGLIINYPLNILLLFIFIDLFDISDPLTLGTLITAVFTIVSYARVYLVRKYYDGI
tara:strand:- start:359 stop:577 length:219 start_codon:yes stop_codon:yes gene_type:complete